MHKGNQGREIKARKRKKEKIKEERGMKKERRKDDKKVRKEERERDYFRSGVAKHIKLERNLLFCIL